MYICILKVGTKLFKPVWYMVYHLIHYWNTWISYRI